MVSIDNINITFETKCWEKDWRYLLQSERLERMIEYNKCLFNERVLYINNVDNISEVVKSADKLVSHDILTSYVVVDDYAQQALDFFCLTKESLGKGYVYSISELVGIFLCKSDFLLHFSSDSILSKPLNWIDSALCHMISNPRIKVANLTWNFRYNEAKQESFEENEDFYIGYGFSDQCYLIKAKDFRNPIYNEKYNLPEVYPEYVGEPFEKRVNSWMRNHEFLRITSRHGSYIHDNFLPLMPDSIELLRKKVDIYFNHGMYRQTFEYLEQLIIIKELLEQI